MSLRRGTRRIMLFLLIFFILVAAMLVQSQARMRIIAQNCQAIGGQLEPVGYGLVCIHSGRLKSKRLM